MEQTTKNGDNNRPLGREIGGVGGRSRADRTKNREKENRASVVVEGGIRQILGEHSAYQRRCNLAGSEGGEGVVDREEGGGKYGSQFKWCVEKKQRARNL